MKKEIIIDKIKSLEMKYGFREKLQLDIDYLIRHNYLDMISKIYVFGSCSKGEETYLSDIDLGIITKTPLDRRVKADIRGELTDSTVHGIETNPVFIYRDELDVNIRLHREIIRGIEIYGEG